MAVFAFQLAEDWLRKSSENITPLQYGLLLDMCAISSHKSAYQCLHYLARDTRAKSSPLLRKAVAVLVFLLTFVRLIALTDLLLHHYTTSGPLITRPVGRARSSNRSSIPSYGTRVYDFYDEDNPAACRFKDYIFYRNCSFLGSNNGTGRWGNRVLSQKDSQPRPTPLRSTRFFSSIAIIPKLPWSSDQLWTPNIPILHLQLGCPQPVGL